MDHVDTLIAARWIIPIEPLGTVLERHAIAVRDGRIVAILPEKQAFERFVAAERIERDRHVLVPGFVNAHTHGAMTLLRGAAESGRFEHWLKQQIWPLEQRWLDAEYVRDGTELAIADMVTSGTTCFADMHLFPEVVAQTAADAKIRACIASPVIDFATVWAGSTDEYFDKGLKLHDEYRNDPLIATMLAPYAPWAVSDATLSRVQRLADELELPFTMHVNESSADNDGAERALARLERLGLLSPLLTAVHMVHVTEDDLERASRGGINVAHCPQSNLKLGNGIAPIAAFREAGLNVALGTDGAASNNDLNMLDELRTAALLANGASPRNVDHEIGAHEWLTIATLNGARALGMAEHIGSLVPGKWADLCCIDLHRAQTQPVHDPAAHLLYSVSREQITDVWVAGRALLANGVLTQLDLEDVLRRARLWGDRISGARSA
jgi:5-methylthioadenosine/S-adenosylhomocysteine deaminase